MTIMGMVGVAAAVGAAIAAIAVGQKGRAVATENKSHPLNGVLQKRINMFQKFADNKFDDVPRPQRGMDDIAPANDYVAA
jgi:hypothetical protein